MDIDWTVGPSELSYNDGLNNIGMFNKGNNNWGNFNEGDGNYGDHNIGLLNYCSWSCGICNTKNGLVDDTYMFNYPIEQMEYSSLLGNGGFKLLKEMANVDMTRSIENGYLRRKVIWEEATAKARNSILGMKHFDEFCFNICCGFAC